jgi:class 3 adenylate cyclase
VDKFVGDAVMAIWNAPSDDPDHIVNACVGALACREANRALNERSSGRAGRLTERASACIQARPWSVMSAPLIG